MPISSRPLQLLLVRAGAVATASSALLVLVSWLTGFDPLNVLLPGGGTIKPNTAVGLLMLGVGLFRLVPMLQTPKESRAAQPTEILLALAVMALAAVTLGQDLFGWDAGLDSLLAGGHVDLEDAGAPNRMSPVTAVNLLLGAAALALLALSRNVATALAQACATSLAVLSLIVIFGYLFDVAPLYRIGSFNTIASHTGIICFVFSLALLFATGEVGWVRDFNRPTPASVAARRLFGSFFVIVPGLAWLRLYGQRQGYYGTEFGVALLATVLIVALGFILWYATHRANLADREIGRLQRLYAMLSQTNQSIVRCPDQGALFERICGVAIEFGEFVFAWIGLLDAETQTTRVVAQAGVEAGVLHDDGRNLRLDWPYAPMLLLDQYLFSANPHASPPPTPWHASAMRAGYCTAAVPIRRDGKVIGSFNLYAKDADFFAPYAVPTLEEAALDISFALDNYGREAARKDALESLRLSERRYTELVDRLPIGLSTIHMEADGRFRYTYVSSQYCRMLDVDADAVLSNHEVLARRVHPDDLQNFRRARERAQRTHDVVDYEVRMLVRGEVIWIRILTMPMSPALDGSVEWNGLIENITERKQAEADRDRLREQLLQAQKMDVLGQLTGGIAHDFNNILGSVLGFTTLALAKEVPNPQSKLATYLREVEQAALRARDLVAKMLKFSRADSRPTVVESLAPGAAAREVLRLLGSMLPSSIEIDLDEAPGLPRIRIDPVEFHQLVMNLAVNARDAMHEHGTLRVMLAQRHVDDGTICQSCQRAFGGEFVELAVKDSGDGIQRAQLETIFQPFFTTKEVGKGTGLGLSMVHGIMHEAGGHILVESAAGQGTCFRLLFPHDTEAPAAVPDVPARRPAVSLDEAHVLVVDDEVALTRLWSELLASRGARVSAFNDSVAALAAFEADPRAYDAALCDMTMPQITGDNLARALLARRPELPVFLCTGYNDRMDAAMARMVGVRAIFEKPIDFDRVLGALSEALAASAAG